MAKKAVQICKEAETTDIDATNMCTVEDQQFNYQCPPDLISKKKCAQKDFIACCMIKAWWDKPFFIGFHNFLNLYTEKL